MITWKNNHGAPEPAFGNLYMDYYTVNTKLSAGLCVVLPYIWLTKPYSGKENITGMNWISDIGLIAAVLTSSSFLPQALKTISTKDTASISLSMYILFTLGTLMWFIYGLVSDNLPVWLANGFTLILASVILFFKVKNTFNQKDKRSWVIGSMFISSNYPGGLLMI